MNELRVNENVNENVKYETKCMDIETIEIKLKH